MTGRQLNQTSPGTQIFRTDAVTLVKSALSDLKKTNSNEELYRYLSQLNRDIEKVLVRTGYVDPATLDAYEGVSISYLYRKLDAEVTAYECGIRPLRSDLIKTWLTSWLEASLDDPSNWPDFQTAA